MDAKSTGPTCDRCGAAAKVHYVRGADIWAWCNHHGREHGPNLEARGFERYELAVPDMPALGSGSLTGS